MMVVMAIPFQYKSCPTQLDGYFTSALQYSRHCNFHIAVRPVYSVRLSSERAYSKKQIRHPYP
jgi:hypothetical protein